jgi:hypothetical protein
MPIGESGYCIAAADLNGDGAIDVAVCSGNIHLFLNGCP